MLSLINPVEWIRVLLDAYDILQSRGDHMNVTTVTCHCGYIYIRKRPDHYGGAAGYPIRCAACDDAAKKVSVGS